MKTWMLLLVLSIMVSGCASFEEMSPNTKAGAQIGGVVGAAGGAAIDKKNPWRGAVIGAAAGALLGGVIGNITDKAAQESAKRNAPVSYERTTDQGWKEQVVATPAGTEGDYKLISVKYIRDGQVISEEVKKVPVTE